jgi:Uncharacterized conserved protein (DUF2181)
MGFSFSDLNPIKAVKAIPKAVDTVVDTAVDAGKAVVDEVKEVPDKAMDLGKDVLAIGSRLATRGNGNFFAASLSAAKRQELMTAATDPANADKRVSGDSTRDLQNAHRTNTPEEMLEALKGDYTSFEGDIRMEQGLFGHGKRQAIMAHDAWGTDGMALKDWMAIGKASGRKLKMDFKESAALPHALALAKQNQIPDDRLIFNGGTSLDWASVRKDFPGATLAINPPGDGDKGEPYEDGPIKETIEAAEKWGKPVIFPLRSDRVTPEVVAALKPYGEVAIWNAPSKHAPDDVAAETQRFRDMGVDGMIDLTGKQH